MNKVIHKTTLSLLGVTILSSLLLSSTHVFSDTEVIDEVRLTVPVACTMSGTGTTHTATLSPGTYSGASGNEYENGIGKTTLTAICNDDNGFSIYAIGFTGNEYGVTNLIGQNTSGTIATKAYESGDTTSNWSMKLTKVDNPASGDPVTYNPENLTISTGYNTWHAVPADYTKVAEYHASTGSSTTDTTLGVKLETTYAAYIASNQAADTYIGQVKYTMVHPYNRAAPEPPMGLCTDSYTCMQQQTSASMAEKLPNVGDTTTLYDARDNQAYTVAKLADGKYWMTENLNIAGGTALSADDTDVTSDYIASFETSNNLTKTNETIVLPTSAIKNSTDNNLTDNTQFSKDNYSYVFNSGNKENCGASGQNEPCYSYYSWDAATLGAGRNIGTDNTDVEISICPRGWRLPTSRYIYPFDNAIAEESDFYKLATSYGMDTGDWFQSTDSFYLQAGPGTVPNFLFSGYYPSSRFTGGGVNGYYIAATSYLSSSRARDLGFRIDNVYSGDSFWRAYGYSVRCLFGS